MHATLLLLVACVRTPPHEAWGGAVTVASGWRVASAPEAPCDWQGEALVSDGTVLWGEVPEALEGPCPAGREQPRLVTVDRLGQDGPFLSTVLQASGPAPALALALAGALDPAGDPPADARPWEQAVPVPPLVSGTATCITWDLRTGRPARLLDYDAEHAQARWRRVTRAAARAHLPAPDPGAFVVDGGHVAFCIPRGPDRAMTWVRVR